MSGFSLYELAQASPIEIRDWSEPLAVSRHVRKQRRAGWHWDGVMVGRVWSPDMPEEEYTLMRMGGNRGRLAAPDETTPLGCRIYRLTPGEARRAQRLLDRECLDGFEFRAPLEIPQRRKFRHHNVACNAGRTVLLNFLAGSGTPTGISYFEVGTGAGTPGAGDIADFTAVFRKVITTATVTGNQADESTFFASTDANYNMTNAGLWGNGATATLGTGSLFAHAVYLYNKTSAVSLTNDYVLSFT